jgi:hypothetical protein
MTVWTEPRLVAGVAPELITLNDIRSNWLNGTVVILSLADVWGPVSVSPNAVVVALTLILKNRVPVPPGEGLENTVKFFMIPDEGAKICAGSSVVLVLPYNKNMSLPDTAPPVFQ